MYILANDSLKKNQLFADSVGEFEVVLPLDEEEVDLTLSPAEVALDIAIQKACAVADGNEQHVVIGTHTVVVFDNMIIGKPIGYEDAFRILKLLNGRLHHVITGVCIIKGEKIEVFYEKTEVGFFDYNDNYIVDYLGECEPFDCDAAYSIEHGWLVSYIKGDYENVLGLPVNRIREVLETF